MMLILALLHFLHLLLPHLLVDPVLAVIHCDAYMGYT